MAQCNLPLWLSAVCLVTSHQRFTARQTDSGSLHQKARYGRFAGCVHALVSLYASDVYSVSVVGVYVCTSVIFAP